MSNKCIRCGVSLDSEAETCPHCSVAHLMAIDSGGAEGHGDASTVSVPVRRKRTLPNSCLLGSLLFIPVLAIAIMLVHFQIKNQEELDERMLREGPQPTPNGVSADTGDMVKMMSAHVKKQSPGIVTSIRSLDGDALVVTVSADWNGFDEKRKKTIMNQWLTHWKHLGGASIVIEAAQTGTEKK